MSAPLLLVFGDSLAFHGPDGPRPADDPRLWPNIMAKQVGGSAELFAGVGWTAREAFWSLTGDPRVWPLLPEIDALILAVGSMDTLPSPLPTFLRQGIRYLRPDRLRRGVRAAYQAAQPMLARLLHGWPVALPATVSVSYLDRCLTGVRALRPGLPVIAVVPAVHRAPSYAFVHTGRARAESAIRAWAGHSDVGLVDLAAVVSDHVLGGHGNADGMHWGWPGHELVGAAFAKVLTGTAVDSG